MRGFHVNPTLIPELARQIIFMLLIFNIIHWTNEQTGAVLAVISGLLSFITSRNTATEHELREAGTDREQVKRLANDPSRELTVQMIDPEEQRRRASERPSGEK